jgi:hypothetical protein
MSERSVRRVFPRWSWMPTPQMCAAIDTCSHLSLVADEIGFPVTTEPSVAPRPVPSKIAHPLPLDESHRIVMGDKDRAAS